MTKYHLLPAEHDVPPERSDSAFNPAAARLSPLTPALVLTLLAVVLWALEISHIRLQAIGNFGFINALPAAFFGAVALLALGFVLALRCPSPPRWLLGVQVLLLLLFLYGTVIIAEPLPRFATAWLHAGFTDYIAHTGRTVPSFDARFNWPGFFSAAAMLTRAAGLKSPVTLLRWAPFYFNALYVIGVYALASAITRSERAHWLAVWLFLTTNWVGQDYFSPQAFAYLLALAFAAIVLTWFRHPPSWFSVTSKFTKYAATTQRRFTRWVSALSVAREEDTSVVASRNEQLVLAAIALAIFAAMTVSHQLTPPAVIIWTLALVITRRCRLSSLPFVMITIFALWLSYGAVAYWSGHLGALFRGFR